MTEQKESSPADSSTSNFPSLSSSSSSRGNDVCRSSSGDIGAESSLPTSDQLHLQVPAPHTHHHHPNSISTGSTSSSQQSSPRPSTTTIPDGIPSRNRGCSSSSSLSIGQISYRDLSDIQDEFKVVKILHDGSFSKILLTKQDTSGENDSEDSSGEGLSGGKGNGVNNKYLVLKAIPSGGLFTEDFKRELRYNYFLSPHPNIVTSFNISFNWASCFNVYVQEHAPFGDLSRYVNSNNGNSSSSSLRKCLPESQVKLIASQLASALEFMHSFNLVHQDVRAENVLIFKSNMSRVKLCDFGSTRKEGTLITKGNLISSSATSTSLLAPEISYLLPQERYECHRSSDVWQMGILLCICLTGKYPWDVAEFSDPTFRQYTSWLKRKSLKVPDPFKKFTPRLVRMLKRLLEPKQHLRSEIREVFKYMSDDWIKPNCNRMLMGSSGSNSSFRNNKKKSVASLHQKKESRNSNGGNIGVGSSGSNKNCSNKLIILTSNGINLLSHHSARKCSSSSRKDEDLSDCNNKQRESRNGGAVRIEAGQENEDGEEEGDNMTKRVEKWVASAAKVALQQGNSSSIEGAEIESNAHQPEVVDD